MPANNEEPITVPVFDNMVKEEFTVYVIKDNTAVSQKALLLDYINLSDVGEVFTGIKKPLGITQRAAPEHSILRAELPHDEKGFEYGLVQETLNMVGINMKNFSVDVCMKMKNNQQVLTLCSPAQWLTSAAVCVKFKLVFAFKFFEQNQNARIGTDLKQHLKRLYEFKLNFLDSASVEVLSTEYCGQQFKLARQVEKSAYSDAVRCYEEELAKVAGDFALLPAREFAQKVIGASGLSGGIAKDKIRLLTNILKIPSLDVMKLLVSIPPTLVSEITTEFKIGSWSDQLSIEDIKKTLELLVQTPAVQEYGLKITDAKDSFLKRLVVAQKMYDTACNQIHCTFNNKPTAKFSQVWRFCITWCARYGHLQGLLLANLSSSKTLQLAFSGACISMAEGQTFTDDGEIINNPNAAGAAIGDPNVAIDLEVGQINGPEKKVKSTRGDVLSSVKGTDFPVVTFVKGEVENTIKDCLKHAADAVIVITDNANGAAAKAALINDKKCTLISFGSKPSAMPAGATFIQCDGILFKGSAGSGTGRKPVVFSVVGTQENEMVNMMSAGEININVHVPYSESNINKNAKMVTAEQWRLVMPDRHDLQYLLANIVFGRGNFHGGKAGSALHVIYDFKNSEMSEMAFQASIDMLFKTASSFDDDFADAFTCRPRLFMHSVAGAESEELLNKTIMSHITFTPADTLEECILADFLDSKCFEATLEQQVKWMALQTAGRGIISVDTPFDDDIVLVDLKVARDNDVAPTHLRVKYNPMFNVVRKNEAAVWHAPLLDLEVTEELIVKKPDEMPKTCVKFTDTTYKEVHCLMQTTDIHGETIFIKTPLQIGMQKLVDHYNPDSISFEQGKKVFPEFKDAGVAADRDEPIKVTKWSGTKQGTGSLVFKLKETELTERLAVAGISVDDFINKTLLSTFKEAAKLYKYKVTYRSQGLFANTLLVQCVGVTVFNKVLQGSDGLPCTDLNRRNDRGGNVANNTVRIIGVLNKEEQKIGGGGANA